MIDIQDLKKTYRMGDVDVPALNGVSLKIQSGEFVAIMGPSGSGKSTLLQILGLLDVPESGSYKLNGQETAGLSEDELAEVRSREIGFVFQQFHLLARTSALENVSLPLIYHAEGSVPPPEGWPEKLLADVGLKDRMHHKPNELSGGQQQRVAIARSLVNRPNIILADEPTGNLDSKSEAEIMALLKSLNAQGLTVIMVTHENEIGAVAKRIIRMRDGKVESDIGGDTSKNEKAAAIEPRPKKSDSSFFARFRYREMKQHFRQAVRAILANKVRSSLSLLGILIGVAALIAMLALGRGAKESIEKQLSSNSSRASSVCRRADSRKPCRRKCSVAVRL